MHIFVFHQTLFDATANEVEGYVDIIRDAFKMRLGVMVCRNFEKINWHKQTAYDSDLNTVYLSTQIKSSIGSDDDENEESQKTAGENGEIFLYKFSPDL